MGISNIEQGMLKAESLPGVEFFPNVPACVPDPSKQRKQPVLKDAGIWET